MGEVLFPVSYTHLDVYKRQVLITERIIKIHTTATDKDGNKELEAGKDATIIDLSLIHISILDNCQMLCKSCNAKKTDKY